MESVSNHSDIITYRNYLSMLHESGSVCDYRQLLLDTAFMSALPNYFKRKALACVIGEKLHDSFSTRRITTAITPRGIVNLIEGHQSIVAVFGSDLTYYTIDRLLIIPFVSKSVF